MKISKLGYIFSVVVIVLGNSCKKPVGIKSEYEYVVNGKVRIFHTYIDDTILHGPTMYYYPNGNLKDSIIFLSPQSQP